MMKLKFSLKKKSFCLVKVRGNIMVQNITSRIWRIPGQRIFQITMIPETARQKLMTRLYPSIEEVMTQGRYINILSILGLNTGLEKKIKNKKRFLMELFHCRSIGCSHSCDWTCGRLSFDVCVICTATQERQALHSLIKLE